MARMTRYECDKHLTEQRKGLEKTKWSCQEKQDHLVGAKLANEWQDIIEIYRR